MNIQQTEIKFPIEWNYKIIVEAVNIDEICRSLEKIWVKYKKLTNLTRNNQSKTGKYISLVVSFHLNSKEQLDSLSTKISKVQGVKFVL